MKLTIESSFQQVRVLLRTSGVLREPKPTISCTSEDLQWCYLIYASQFASSTEFYFLHRVIMSIWFLISFHIFTIAQFLSEAFQFRSTTLLLSSLFCHFLTSFDELECLVDCHCCERFCFCSEQPNINWVLFLVLVLSIWQNDRILVPMWVSIIVTVLYSISHSYANTYKRAIIAPLMISLVTSSNELWNWYLQCTLSRNALFLEKRREGVK